MDRHERSALIGKLEVLTGLTNPVEVVDLALATTLAHYLQDDVVYDESSAIAAEILQHPDWDYRINRLDEVACKIEILRRNEDGNFESVGETTFSADDAEKAGLADNQIYQQYPRNMLFAWALIRAQRMFMPDEFCRARRVAPIRL